MKMKIIVLLLFLSAIIVTVFAFRPKPSPTPDKASFKVIELFTSEGCSSCPAADALVDKISKEFKGEEVYILAYHVDYWNKLGWKDPFSKAEYSARQYKYGQYFKLRSIYTPQIVINGRTEFVGSDESKLRTELARQEENAPAPSLTIGAILIDKKTAIVNFSELNASKNEQILISLVQKIAVSKVANGENGGRTLSHVQIVVDQQAIAANASNKTVVLALPTAFDPAKFEVIGFVQKIATGNIIAATRKSF